VPFAGARTVDARHGITDTREEQLGQDRLEFVDS